MKNNYLRMADGGALMDRFARRQPLQMQYGGDNDYSREGMLRRNPGVAQNQIASPSAPLAPAPVQSIGGPNMSNPGAQPAVAPVDQGAAMDRKMLGLMAAPVAAAPVAAAPTALAAPRPKLTLDQRLNRQIGGGSAQPAPVQGLGELQFKHGGSLRMVGSGEVQGPGGVDKVPAMYTKGEFVVSNDMLDAAPGLREQLHDLRGNVLAEKGMTPEMADAKAMKGGTLRAQDAFGWPEDHPARRALVTRPNFVFSSNAPFVSPPEKFPTAGNPNVGAGGSAEARAFREAQARAAAAAEMAKAPPVQPSAAQPTKPTGVWNSIKSGASAVGSGVKSVATGRILDADVGRMGSGALRSLTSGAGRVFAPIGLGATAAQVAGTDTQEYADRMGATAGEGFLKDVGIRGVGALADLGDAVTFGQATRLGNLIAGNGYNPNSPQAAAAPQTPREAPYNPNQTGPTRQRTGLRLDQGDPGRGAGPTDELRTLSRDMTGELSGRPGGRMSQLPSDLREGVVHKTVDAQGRVTYSGRNVAPGADGNTQMVDGMGRSQKMRGSVESASGPVGMTPGGYAFTPADPKATAEQRAARQAEITQTLRNPDGSTWSAGDNAIMAANLRDGIDPYIGTSRQPAQSGSPGSDLDSRLQKAMDAYTDPKRQIGTGKALRTQIQALTEMRNNETTSRTSSENNEATNRTNLRGQDVELERGRITAETARLAAQRSALKDERDHQASRGDKKLEQDAKAVEQARAALQIFRKDDKGNPVKDEQATDAAFQLMQRQNQNWATEPQAKRSQLLTDARDTVELIGNFDKNRNNTWWQKYGLGANDAKLSTLPKLKGATMEEMDVASGMGTAGASTGDYRLTVDGKQLYLSRDDVTQDQLAFLKRQGVKFK